VKHFVSRRIAILSSLIGSGFLGYRILKTGGDSYAAFIVVIASLVVGCLPRPRVRDVIASSVAPSLLAVAISRGAVLVKNPFASIYAQDPGQDLVIAIMIGVFALSSFQASRTISVALGILFVASLPFHGVALVTIAVGMLSSRARDGNVDDADDHEVGASPSVASAPVVLAGLVVGIASVFPSSSPSMKEQAPDDPPRAVEYWRKRENLFRARHVALGWATKEKTPGEGYLTLAIVDWDLGEREKAQKVLSKVLTRTDDPSVRERAEALTAKWGTSPPERE
jgi:hypothetical protein